MRGPNAVLRRKRIKPAAHPELNHPFRPDEDGYYCLDCRLPLANWRHQGDQQ